MTHHRVVPLVMDVRLEDDTPQQDADYAASLLRTQVRLSRVPEVPHAASGETLALGSGAIAAEVVSRLSRVRALEMREAAGARAIGKELSPAVFMPEVCLALGRELRRNELEGVTVALRIRCSDAAEQLHGLPFATCVWTAGDRAEELVALTPGLVLVGPRELPVPMELEWELPPEPLLRFQTLCRWMESEAGPNIAPQPIWMRELAAARELARRCDAGTLELGETLQMLFAWQGEAASMTAALFLEAVRDPTPIVAWLAELGGSSERQWEGLFSLSGPLLSRGDFKIPAELGGPSPLPLVARALRQCRGSTDGPASDAGGTVADVVAALAFHSWGAAAAKLLGGLASSAELSELFEALPQLFWGSEEKTHAPPAPSARGVVASALRGARHNREAESALEVMFASGGASPSVQVAAGLAMAWRAPRAEGSFVPCDWFGGLPCRLERVAASALCRALDDPAVSLGVRIAAATALGLQPSARATGSLASVLRNSRVDRDLRACAAAALGNTPGASACAALVSAVGDARASEELGGEITRALGEHAATRALRTLLTLVLDREAAPSVRFFAVWALSHRHTDQIERLEPQASGALRAIAADENLDRGIRGGAIRLLARLRRVGPAPMIALAANREADACVRGAAIDSLRDGGIEAAEMLAALLADQTQPPEVSAAAARAAVRFCDASVVRALAGVLLRRHAPQFVRSSAAWALARVAPRDPYAVGAFRDVLAARQDDPQVRCAVAFAAKHVGPPLRDELLRVACDRREPSSVRWPAALALGSCDEPGRALLATYDSEPRGEPVVGIAAEALTSLRGAEAERAQLALFRRKEVDEHARARLAAALGKATGHVAESAEVLMRAGKDPDEPTEVRVAALLALGKLGVAWTERVSLVQLARLADEPQLVRFAAAAVCWRRRELRSKVQHVYHELRAHFLDHAQQWDCVRILEQTQGAAIAPGLEEVLP